MDKNNLKSFMGKMNDAREIIEVNQGIVMDMMEQIREGQFVVETGLVEKSRPKKATKEQRAMPKKPKKPKKPKETPPRVNRQQLLDQQERKRQEAAYMEDERVQNIEATRSYWEEAMMLAEIVGPPVCKRRGRRRPGGLNGY